MIIFRKDSIKDLGKRFKELRMRRGLSLKAFAQPNGFEFSTVYRMEEGQINPRLSTLVRFAIANEMTIEEVLDGINYQEEVDDSWDRWGDW